jgi:5-methylcytosine-specific restriction enzyme A
MRTWIYKCNATHSAGPQTGDWRDLFDKGDETWGDDTLKGMKNVRVGDQIIAVQSDRHELVGTARALGFVRRSGRRRIRLRPLEVIRVKIPRLKTESRAIAAIPALLGGPVATIYSISDSDADLLLTAARNTKAAKRLATEEVELGAGYPEGATTEIRVNAYERSSTARRACLRHWGSSCFACRLELGKLYGRRADGLIHVHHVVPLAAIRKTYRVDPVKDLRPLCPNCHAVVHRTEPPMPVEALRKLFDGRRMREAGNIALQRAHR